MTAPDEESRIDSEPPTLSAEEETLFGFDSTDEDWIEFAHESETPDTLGGIGSYELIEEIDRGGQGVVYRARQPGTGRDIALKRLIAGSFSSRASRDRFQHEIEAAASLNHPGIVTIHGFEVVDGLPLMAMEWIDGIPINRWARPNEAAPRTEKEIFSAFLELCAAVRHAHQNGVLHRDLKPSNVLVSKDGHPHVLDFGLAKPLAPSGEVVVSGDFAGTPAYASPEQFTSDRLDVRSDVYSLGVILYEMLTGERPFRPEEGIRQFFEALEREESARPSTLRRELGQEIDWICARALAPERTERYQSVDALADDLRRYLTGEPVLAHPASALYQWRKLILRNPLVSSLTALLFVTLFAGATFYRHNARVLADRTQQVTAARDAEAITRARAETARDAEAVAREQAERARDSEAAAREQAEQARDAERLAREELEVQNRTSLLAQRRALAILDFLREDVLLAGDPMLGGADTTLREALDHASARIRERFQRSAIIGAYVQRNLGQIQWRLGLHAEAESSLRSAIATARAEVADLSEAGAGCFLGGLLCDRGKLEEAEELLQNSRAIFERHTDREESYYWQTLHQLAHLYLETGNLAACEQAVLDVMEYSSAVRDEEPAYYCGALVDRGRLELARGEHLTAIATLESARTVHAGFSDGSDSDYGALLHALAEAKFAIGEFAEAELVATNALEVYRQSIFSEHPRIGEVLSLLAILAENGATSVERGRAFAREALSIANATGEPDSPTRTRIRRRLKGYDL